jgi:hypothetical protein
MVELFAPHEARLRLGTATDADSKAGSDLSALRDLLDAAELRAGYRLSPAIAFIGRQVLRRNN